MYNLPALAAQFCSQAVQVTPQGHRWTCQILESTNSQTIQADLIYFPDGTPCEVEVWEIHQDLERGETYGQTLLQSQSF